MNTDNLLEPQKLHAKTLLDSIYLNGFAFDASPTGTGKTYSASAIAKNLNLPVVVICPKVSRKTWIDTLAMFGIKAHTVINYEKLVRGNTEHYVFNKKEYVNRKYWWESTGIKVKFPKNSLVIIDECHKCKGAKSKNGEMLTALKNNGYKILLLSATAATNVTEMKHFGYTTNLHNGRNFYTFAREHGAENDEFGGLTTTKDETKAKSGMSKIHTNLFNLQNCASKMKIEDFGSIFPDNRIIAESFDLGKEGSKKLQAVYDRMEEELAALDARAQNYSEHIFAVIMKARRHSELLKVPVTAEWIEDKMDEGVSPVVFFNFSDSLQAVEERLSKSFSGLIAKIVGGQNQKQRDTELEEFQSNKRRIVLANMSAGSASINLHDLDGKFPRESLICPSWSAIMTLQAIGRIYRANGKSKCVQKFLFASDIEERQRARVASKIKNIGELNDGDLRLIESVPLY
jgi:hypothetical protein